MPQSIHSNNIELSGRQKSVRMKRVQKVISILFKAMNYGGQGVDKDNAGNHEGDGSRNSRRPPSAPSQRKPPVIRIHRGRSFEPLVWGSPQQLTTTSDSANTTIDRENTLPRRSKKRQSHHNKSGEHHSRSPSRRQSQSPNRRHSQSQILLAQEAINMASSAYNNNSRLHSSNPHLDSGNLLKVDEQSRHHQHRRQSTHAIRTNNNNNDDKEANNNHSKNINHNNNQVASSSYSPEAERFVRAAIDKSRPVERQVIRIINGNEPSVQSQVLLNTKTSQPFDDLVRDLGMAVKLPKKRESHMETISGRRIQSYSQLRSELQAGNHAFYVYSDREDLKELGLPSLNQTFTLEHNTPRSRRVERHEPHLGIQQQLLSQSHNPLPTVHHNNNNINIHNQNQIHKSASSISVPNAMSRHGSNSNENVRKPSIKPITPTSSATNLNSSSNATVARNSSSNRLNTSNHVNTSTKSNPNLLSANYNQGTTKQPRHRSTRRRRSEASVYLASASRSRSVSPD